MVRTHEHKILFAYYSDLGIGDGTLDVPNSSSGISFLVTLNLTQDPGDLDGNGEVTSADITILTSSFGCTQCSNLDLDGDGVVNVADLYLYLDLIDGYKELSTELCPEQMMREINHASWAK